MCFMRFHGNSSSLGIKGRVLQRFAPLSGQIYSGSQEQWLSETPSSFGGGRESLTVGTSSVALSLTHRT